MAIISKLKAILTLDNKQFQKGLDESKKKVGFFGKEVNKLGGALAAMFAVKNVVAFTAELGKLSVVAKNVGKSFETLGIELDTLRKATGGGIGDLRLQRMAINARNLGVNVNDLARLFKFATIRAAETGESIDYLVNSIVIGIGRKSPKILDNLGIGLVELQQEFKKSGDYAKAALTIVDRELSKSLIDVDEAVAGVDRLSVAWDNLKKRLAEGDVGQDSNKVLDWFASIIEPMFGGKYDEMTLEELSAERDYMTDLLVKSKFAPLIASNIDKITAAMKRLEDATPKKTIIPTVAQESPYGSIFSSGLSDASSQYAQANMGLSTMVALMSELGLKATIASTSMQGLAATQGSVISQSSATIDQINMLNSALENAATQGIAMAAQAIGTMIGGDTESALENFVQGIAGLLEGFGALLISFGVSLAVLKDSMNPYAMIAAGAALVIIGAAMSASLGGISSAAGGGGSAVTGGYGGGGYSGGSGYDYNREIVLVARGEDLVGVINRQNYMNNTNG